MHAEGQPVAKCVPHLQNLASIQSTLEQPFERVLACRPAVPSVQGLGLRGQLQRGDDLGDLVPPLAVALHALLLEGDLGLHEHRLHLHIRPLVRLQHGPVRRLQRAQHLGLLRDFAHLPSPRRVRLTDLRGEVVHVRPLNRLAEEAHQAQQLARLLVRVRVRNLGLEKLLCARLIRRGAADLLRGVHLGRDRLHLRDAVGSGLLEHSYPAQ